MGGIDLFVLILPRTAEAGYRAFLQAEGLRTCWDFPCRGTARPNLLSRLGLENTEKILFLFTTTHQRASRLMRRCVTEMGLNLPGNGIALRLPVQSVGGSTAMQLLMENQPYDLSEVRAMAQPEFPCSLIVAICESGHSELVMDAAREAGAGGGTVVHAKGTAGELAQKFLGVSLANEKELVLIVSAETGRRPILQAIMDKAGIQTEAHTVAFSLPVEEVAGLKAVMQQEEPA